MRYTAAEALSLLESRGTACRHATGEQGGEVGRGARFAEDLQELRIGLLQFLSSWESASALSQVRSLRVELRRDWAAAQQRSDEEDVRGEEEARRLEVLDVWIELGRLEVLLACYSSREGKGEQGDGANLSLHALARMDWVLDEVLMAALLDSQRTCGDLRWPRLYGRAHGSAPGYTRRKRNACPAWGCELPAKRGAHPSGATQASPLGTVSEIDVMIGWPCCNQMCTSFVHI